MKWLRRQGSWLIWGISPAFSISFLIPPCLFELWWLEQHIVPTVWLHWHLIKRQWVSCLVLNTLPDDIQHYIGFFGCYPTLNWWLQGIVNGNSKVSSLSYNFSVHIVQIMKFGLFFLRVCAEASMTPACLLTQLSKLFLVFFTALHFIAQKEVLENSPHTS